MSKQTRIGLIGLGGMANWHIEQLHKVEGVSITAICDVQPQALQATGDRLNIPAEKQYSDYNKLVADQDVDAIVSVTPNHTHAGILLACIREGKALFAEKPLTRTFEEAVQVIEAYQQRPIPCMVNFTYRYTPTFRYAKHLIEEGVLGEPHHISVQYLQGWGAAGYDTPFVWRFDADVAGTGTLGDLGSHMIDIARFLVGEFEELSGQLRTIIPERKHPVSGEMRQVHVDDFVSFQSKFTNGAVGVFQSTRNALGSDNQHEVSIYGDRATLHGSTLHSDQVILIKADEHGTMQRQTLEVPEQFRINPYQAFIDLVRGQEQAGTPQLIDGYINQEILEAVSRSAELKRTVKLTELRPALVQL